MFEMDNRRFQLLMLGIAGFLTSACLFIVAFFPFPVNLRAQYAEMEGDVYFINTSGDERQITEGLQLFIKEGEGLRVEGEGSQIRIELFADSNIYAYLLDSADWTMVEAWRRATFINHLRGSSTNKTYRYVVEQTQGTALYDFSQADISPKDLDFEIRFPDGKFQPDSTCFQAVAAHIENDTEIPGQVIEIPCYEQQQTEQESILD